MRAGLIVSGVLGGGVTITFAAAALAASMLPAGGTIPAVYGGQAREQFLVPQQPLVINGQTGVGWGGIAVPDEGTAPPSSGGPRRTVIPVGNTSAP